MSTDSNNFDPMTGDATTPLDLVMAARGALRAAGVPISAPAVRAVARALAMHGTLSHADVEGIAAEACPTLKAARLALQRGGR